MGSPAACEAVVAAVKPVMPAAAKGTPRVGVAAVGMPKLLRMTRFPSRAAAFAAWTASLGCAFLHST